MLKKSVEVEILVNGTPVTEYFHSGNNFIEGRKNSSFTIRITNNNLLDPILAIVSVDGLSVINSEKASEKSPGYVIRPGAHTDITGWRIDDSKVSEFVFNKRENSYAAAIDQDGHEGSIGVMIFRDDSFSKLLNNWNDKPYLVDPNPQPMATPWWIGNSGNVANYSTTINKSSSDISCNITSTLGTTVAGAVVDSHHDSTNCLRRVNRRIDATPDEKIGVGHGEQVESKVETTTFNKPDKPESTFVFFYDTRKGLEKRGIKISNQYEVEEPSPFPASSEYCKMPKGGWKK